MLNSLGHFWCIFLLFPAPDGPPQDVQLEPISSQSIRVTWKVNIHTSTDQIGSVSIWMPSGEYYNHCAWLFYLEETLQMPLPTNLKIFATEGGIMQKESLPLESKSSSCLHFLHFSDFRDKATCLGNEHSQNFTVVLGKTSPETTGTNGIFFPLQ